MAMETNGGVDVLYMRTLAIVIGNGCSVGYLGRWSKIIDDCGNSVWLTVGESDGERDSFVVLISGIRMLLYSLGYFDNNG